MKRFTFVSGSMIAAAFLALPTMAFATVHPSCVVKDVAGHELQAQTGMQMIGNVMIHTGSGTNFTYRVELNDKEAKLEFVDTRSGDKATLDEGIWDLGEQVVLGLVTDEAPAEAMTLTCKTVEIP